LRRKAGNRGEPNGKLKSKIADKRQDLEGECTNMQTTRGGGVKEKVKRRGAAPPKGNLKSRGFMQGRRRGTVGGQGWGQAGQETGGGLGSSGSGDPSLTLLQERKV